jgi:predicted nucleic acid-binding Zn ribbon protein
MEWFKSKCPKCGKEVIVSSPDGKAFCSKVCEYNYNFEKNRMYHPDVKKMK